MKRVEILLDDQTDQILDSLAAQHQGDRSEAVREALRAQGVIAAFLDEIEDQNAVSLKDQLERSKQDFQAGRVKTWEEVKRKAGL